MARHRARAAWRGSAPSAQRPPHAHLSAALVALLAAGRVWGGVARRVGHRGGGVGGRNALRPPGLTQGRQLLSRPNRGPKHGAQRRVALLACTLPNQRAWSSGRGRQRRLGAHAGCARARACRAAAAAAAQSAGAPPESRGAAASPIRAAARRGRARGPRGGGRRARGARWSAASRGRAPRPPHSRAARQSSRAWCRPPCARLQKAALGSHVRREKSGAKGWCERAGGSRRGPTCRRWGCRARARRGGGGGGHGGSVCRVCARGLLALAFTGRARRMSRS